MFKRVLIAVSALLFVGCVASTTNVPVCGQPNLPPVDQSNVVTNFMGNPVMWDPDAFPIRVVVDPEMREERRQVVHEAVIVWDAAVGQRVFTYEEGPRTTEEGTIWITEEALPTNPCKQQLFGLARRAFRTDLLGVKTAIVRGFIRLHTGVPEERILGTAIHELGHTLGFHHDRDINSIMYPYNTEDRGIISGEDIAHVRRMMDRSRAQSSAHDFDLAI